MHNNYEKVYSHFSVIAKLVEDNLDEGEKLSKALGDTHSLSMFYNWKAAYYQMTGELKLGLKYAEETLKESEKINNIDLVTQSTIALINAHNLSGQYYKAALCLSLRTVVIKA